MTQRPDLQPYEAFLEETASARYEDARRSQDASVESDDAFAEMQAYVLGLYDDIEPVDSVVDAGGQILDYIPEAAHPSVRRWGRPAVSPDTGPPAVSQPEGESTPGPIGYQVAHPRPHGDLVFPEGTVPLYRTTLTTLSRFPTLAAFLARRGMSRPATAEGVHLLGASFPKRYATGEQEIDCLGGSSKVNVWGPFAAANVQSTFSQQWYTAVQEGTLLQSVECGWHVDVARYHDAQPHLFVYATRQNYAENAGLSVVNAEGGVFQLVANPYTVPGAPLPVSQVGGRQVEYSMGFYLTNGAWWFYFDGEPIGCFPVAWFDDGPLTTRATKATFGGEVGTGLALWPAMGSGQPAAAGFGHASYQRAATVFSTGGGAVFANLAEAGSVTGSCYTLEITNNSTDFNWGTYLFFGGPGGNGC